MPETPTIITLTLPPSDRLDGQGTLLIQRGPLAHLTQFTYISVQDIAAAIQSAHETLAAVENDPPIIPDAVPPTPKAISPRTTQSSEPMLTIPVGKKTLDIPARYLQLAQPNQQAQAIQIASKLLVSQLWDGKTLIRIADTEKVLTKLKPLDDKTLSLFTLTDFVEVSQPEAFAPPVEEAGLETGDVPLPLQVGQHVHLTPGATDTDGDPVAFSTGRIVEIDDGEQPTRVWIESLDGENDVWVSADHIQPLTTAQ